MSHGTVLFACIAGFAALALATERQQGALLGRTLAPPTVRKLRVCGTFALLLAYTVAVAQWGWGVGSVAYSGHTSAAAAAVHLALIARARALEKRA